MMAVLARGFFRSRARISSPDKTDSFSMFIHQYIREFCRSLVFDSLLYASARACPSMLGTGHGAVWRTPFSSVASDTSFHDIHRYTWEELSGHTEGHNG